jgi:alkylation response protein AidB-like acyl-CoA dehydrogenase
MDGEERELLEKGLRHAAGNHTGDALDAALGELGWRDALAADARAAVSLLFELQGAANATSSALHDVVLAALDTARTPAAGVVLPPLGGWDAPGRVDGGELAVRGVGTDGLCRRPTAVVVAAATGEGHVAAIVETADLELRPVAGIDPSVGMVEVAAGRVGRRDREPAPPAAWPAALAAGQLALGHELVGAARQMLRLACDHARERIQFGRPIASFQAVSHALADARVAIDAAEAALHAAWDDGSPLTAALAKALAGRGARAARRHCQQVLAGIGFTTDHPLHRYVRRTLVLDSLLGDARSLTRWLGDDLLRTRRLPAILPL